jgi:hypothetical protein
VKKYGCRKVSFVMPMFFFKLLCNAHVELALVWLFVGVCVLLE